MLCASRGRLACVSQDECWLRCKGKSSFRLGLVEESLNSIGDRFARLAVQFQAETLMFPFW